MAIAREVRCANKPLNSSLRQKVTHIGGDWGLNGQRIRVTEGQAIRDIQAEEYSYYIRSEGIHINLYIDSIENYINLSTNPDENSLDKLCRLPECLNPLVAHRPIPGFVFSSSNLVPIIDPISS